MRYENLLEPISDESPCGPDLLLEDDDGYIDYYFEALDRVPMRFIVNQETGEVFDRKNIDIKKESAEIAKLLERTRDLRLLVLEAQFQALAGRVVGFSECTNAMASLIETYWHDVNPKIDEGDTSERRNAIELLNELGQVCMPLEHADLFEDRRAGRISFRDFQVSSGAKEARPNENPPDSGSILTAVKSADNAEAVDKAYGALVLSREACSRMGNMCKTADSSAFAPQLSQLEETLDRMIAFFKEARPDLVGGDAGEAGEDGEIGIGEDGQPMVAPTGGGMVASGPPVAVGTIPNHATAKAALEAVEGYFAAIEPSAPALLLIRQAQDLIGKPLTEALDALLPSMSSNALVDFGSEDGFFMNVDRLRQLAAYELPSTVAPIDTGPAEPVECQNRDQAAALISAVESFFRQTEPSSPVPVLLFKAKTYLNRDFSSILSDLFQHMNKQG
ncbi:type VI secretion system ImpA family N-terminal domain-containing protein [Vannielia sp.]|uniref:type VI secretion system protein TssA n=1 Tax=Vannielia sp. TaxID=2813045 RepID=UPI00262D784D|nr:type VI secretion system ImpA family N-terminal domain-containing protein [Vannielia sp.]MDF1872441.1 type VI secretion system ImpA family N-terminal domain-containing protein [Vannielia sp.]